MHVTTSDRRRLSVALATLGVLAVLGLASTAAATPADIEAKRAEAQELYAELQAMDAELERAVDAFNGASYRLDRIDAAIATNQRRLEIARRSYRAAQRNLEERLVALYTEGNPDALEVILGAANLDDLLDRLDTVDRVSTQDSQIIASVRASRASIKRQEAELERAGSEQRAVVADRAAARDAIETKLGERQAYYEEVEDQIAVLVAEERERQRRLAEEAQQAREEQRRLAAAAEAAGVDTSVVATAASAVGSSSTAEASVPVVSAPEGMGTAPASAVGARAAQEAMRYLGVPYVWGGASPSGFDCSGLVKYVYAKFGVSLPHHAATMFGYGVALSYGQLQPGDLVFANGLGHMGMYIGGGNYVHAPQTGDVVKITPMSSRSDWVGFRRVA